MTNFLIKFGYLILKFNLKRKIKLLKISYVGSKKKTTVKGGFWGGLVAHATFIF